MLRRFFRTRRVRPSSPFGRSSQPVEALEPRTLMSSVNIDFQPAAATAYGIG